MLFGPPMLGLLADFTKVRWAFVANAAMLAVTAALFAALAGEPGRGLYLPPAAAAAACEWRVQRGRGLEGDRRAACGPDAQSCGAAARAWHPSCRMTASPADQHCCKEPRT